MQEPGVRVTMLAPDQPMLADADLVILPGSKSTRDDLAFLRAQGWDIDISAHHRRGGSVKGICSSYQMLGHEVAYPGGLEGPAGTTPGLRLLDIRTRMGGDKSLREMQALHVATEQSLRGYEIHIGQSDGPDRARPFARIDGQPEGAVSRDGRVTGSYLHGMFADDAFRAAWLGRLGAVASGMGYAASVHAMLDALVAHLETHLDVGGLLAVAL